MRLWTTFISRFRWHACVISFLFVSAPLVGCHRVSEPEPPSESTLREAAQAEADAKADFAETVENFCGACHGVPRPSSFAKSNWPEEVDQGFRLFFKSGRNDLRIPRPKDAVLRYFQDSAPDELTIPPPNNTDAKAPIEFARQEFPLVIEDRPMTISNLRWLPETIVTPTTSSDTTRPSDLPDVLRDVAGLYACEMRRGYLARLPLDVSTASQTDGELPYEVLEKFHNIAFVEPVDLDGNGGIEFLVADLGSFQPSDHHKGKVYHLKRDDQGNWMKEILLRNVGRVAMLETGDFDSDSRIDILVSEFGWRETGSLTILRNKTSEDGIAKFEAEILDERSGAIQIQKCDLNVDGKLDFVTIFSQEHEQVVAFLNTGNGTFERKLVWEPGYPSYGSSGIELVDLDGDNDMDVLYSNGDSFDDHLLKPYHSIQWLENRGQFPFVHHEITKMPGVSRALPGDFDGDGDLDIIAVSLLPSKIENPADFELDSVIFLEQSGGQFIRYPIETGATSRAALEVGDFDQDGDLDFAVGEFMHNEDRSSVVLWWNQLKQPQ